MKREKVIENFSGNVKSIEIEFERLTEKTEQG